MGVEFLILAAALAAPPPAGPSQIGPSQTSTQPPTATPPAAAEGAQTKTVSPVTVSPLTKPPSADVTLNMQGDEDDVEQLVTVWPGTAYQAGANGRVTLRCAIDVHGLAERCEVAYEHPQGKGFGKAALELRPTFLLPPTLGPDGQPIATTKNIAITFKAPDRAFDMGKVLQGETRGQGNAVDMRKVTMLDYPVWAQAASFDDLAQAYPAKGDGAQGYAVDHCMVRRTGALFNCQTIKEEPQGRDFGKAALTLAPKFKVIPQLAVDPRHSAQLWVDVPIRFPSRQELAERTIRAPVWLTTIDAKAAPKLFPPEAVAKGLTTGRGVARCTVGPDGALSACAAETGDPDGLGFSEAAARLATGMRMNLWSGDGAPVEGGVVHVPVRLNLKSGG
ncbi:MAG TPA: hypothetical protein VHW05_05505 [Phenylobacterium sp.]|jgi:hypothetical protein|nr:hypothetical protein [Phenylobacterium sp.]